MMELFPTWLTPGTTDSLLLLVGEQPQTDLIAGALHSLSPCAGGASGGRLAVWCTGRYSLLAAAELQADTLDLAWDTFSANKLATVGAGPHLSFWTLLERPSCRSSELQASHVPVPQELLHTEVAVGGGVQLGGGWLWRGGCRGGGMAVGKESAVGGEGAVRGEGAVGGRV